VTAKPFVIRNPVPLHRSLPHLSDTGKHFAVTLMPYVGDGKHERLGRTAMVLASSQAISDGTATGDVVRTA